MAGPVRDAILQHLAAGHTVERRDATRLFGPLALSVLSQLTTRGAVSRQRDTYAARIRAIPDPQLAAIEARERQERNAQARKIVADSLAADRAEYEAKKQRAAELKRQVAEACSARRERARLLDEMPEGERPRFLRAEAKQKANAELLESFAPMIEKLQKRIPTEKETALMDAFNLDMDELE